jgi:hypothetical protein
VGSWLHCIWWLLLEWQQAHSRSMLHYQRWTKFSWDQIADRIVAPHGLLFLQLASPTLTYTFKNNLIAGSMLIWGMAKCCIISMGESISLAKQTPFVSIPGAYSRRMCGNLVVCELASWTGIFQYRYVRHFKIHIIYIYIYIWYGIFICVFIYIHMFIFTFTYNIYIYIRTYTRWPP